MEINFTITYIAQFDEEQAEEDFHEFPDGAIAFSQQPHDEESAHASYCFCGEHRHHRHCAHHVALQRNLELY